MLTTQYSCKHREPDWKAGLNLGYYQWSLQMTVQEHLEKRKPQPALSKRKGASHQETNQEEP